MPRNGSGIYGPPAGTAAVPNTTIESADYNAVVADLAQALTDSVNVQGTAPYQANQPMGGNKLTNLGTGAAAGDSANLGQVQSAIVAHASSVAGSVDAITGTFSPAFAAYTAKMRFRFTAGGANTIAAPTVNVDGLGAKTIKKLNGIALSPGDIAGSGHICDCVYNGTDVILLNPAASIVDVERTWTTKQSFSKPAISTIATLTDAATIAWDMNANPNNVRISLTASRALGLPTNLNTGQSGLLIVQQDATGGRSLTLDAIFKQSGGTTVFDLDKTANAKTVFAYQVIEDHTATKVILLERLWTEGKNSIGFWKEYDAGVYTTGLKTVNHGLGRMPAMVQWFLQLDTAQFSYTTADYIDFRSISDGSSDQLPTTFMNTTQARCVFRNTNGSIQRLDFERSGADRQSIGQRQHQVPGIRMIPKINVIVATAGLTLWGWLPYLQSVSDIAGALVPIVTLAWILYQWRTAAGRAK